LEFTAHSQAASRTLTCFLRFIYMPPKTDFVTVYVATSQPEAEIVKGRLSCEGIPAILRYEAAGMIYGLTIDGLGQVEVQVPSRLAKRAMDILAYNEKDTD